MFYDVSAMAISPTANDAELIRACKAVLAADLAFHAACNTGQDDGVIRLHAHHRQALIAPLLAMPAQTSEGARAKANVVSALYDWPNADDAESRDDLIGSLVSSLSTPAAQRLATAG
jgi:hypothetical protein